MKKIKKTETKVKSVTNNWIRPFLDELTLVPGIDLLLRKGKSLIRSQQGRNKKDEKPLKKLKNSNNKLAG